MVEPGEPIVILRSPIERAELERLVHAFFGNMAKFVVDLERALVARLVGEGREEGLTCSTPP